MLTASALYFEGNAAQGDLKTREVLYSSIVWSVMDQMVKAMGLGPLVRRPLI